MLTKKGGGGLAVASNTTFNNNLVISWRKPVCPEKTDDLSQVTDRLYNIMLYRVNLTSAGFTLTTLVVIGTDCTGSCKSNYYTIMTKTVPVNKGNADTVNRKQTYSSDTGESTSSSISLLFFFS